MLYLNDFWINKKDFCLSINILEGNYWILRIGIVGRCQKVPKFDFQSQFYKSKVICLLERCGYISNMYFYCWPRTFSCFYCFTILQSNIWYIKGPLYEKASRCLRCVSPTLLKPSRWPKTCTYSQVSIKRASLLNYFCIFEDHFFVLKEFFSENSVLMYGFYSRAASNQERLMMARVRYDIIFSTKLDTTWVQTRVE